MATRTPIPSEIPASSVQGTIEVDLEVRAGEETSVTVSGVGEIVTAQSKTTRAPTMFAVVASIATTADMTVEGVVGGGEAEAVVEGTGFVGSSASKGTSAATTVQGTGSLSAAAPKGVPESATISGTGVVEASLGTELRTEAPVMSAMVATIGTHEIATISGTAVPHDTTTEPVVSAPIAASITQGTSIGVQVVLGGTNRQVDVVLYGSAGISTFEFALSAEILSPLPNAYVDRPYTVQVRGMPVGATVEILDDSSQVIGTGVIGANGLCDVQIN